MESQETLSVYRKRKNKVLVKKLCLRLPIKVLHHTSILLDNLISHIKMLCSPIYSVIAIYLLHSLLLTRRFVTHPEYKASLFVRSKHIDDLYSLMTQLRISCQQLGQAQMKQTSHSQINVSASLCLHRNAVERLQGKLQLQDLEAGNPISCTAAFTISLP